MSNDQNQSDSPVPSRIGTTVAGRYFIVSQLGEGGIGTVYLADDAVLRQRVALKLLKREYATDNEVLTRFDREAKAMTALAHEHIVRALEFGRTPDGDVCLVMELVEGETLRTMLSRLKPFPPAVTVTLAQQIGAALARAHSLGIVHRDLKPENVMIATTPDQRPFAKVLDFGMARIMGGVFGGTSALTKKGAVFGTPEYMPPEQAMGQPVDARADQYALGVMVFEMIAGRRPFKASTPLEMVQMQIRQAPPPLSEFAPGVPAEVAAVVAKMLAKRADDRFPDVPAATTALARAAAGNSAAPSMPGPPHSMPAGEVRPSQPESRRWWNIFKP